MSKTVEVLEEVVETIDETLDTLERIPAVNLNGTTKGQQVLILTFTAAVAAGVGGFATYKITQAKLRKHYEALAEQEIAEARAYFAGNKTGVFSDPLSAAAALIPDEERAELVTDAAESIDEYSAGVPPQSEKDRLLASESLKVPYHEMYEDKDSDKPDISLATADAIIQGNPNADPQEVMGRVKFPKTPADADNFDMEKEAPLRGLENPYVITHDEFFQGDRGFEQQSLTWFSGDSVLVDNAEDVIGDVNGMVGTFNMSRFGHGSKDENIVYLRNERYEIDFEIALSEGTYTREVLGLDPPG